MQKPQPKTPQTEALLCSAEAAPATPPPTTSRTTPPATSRPAWPAAERPTPQNCAGPCLAGPTKPGSTEDEVCWQSNDGQVTFLIKARPNRWPRSSYPVLVAALRAKQHTRIQPLDDGSAGVEALLTHEEIEQLVDGINRIALQTGKGKLFEILQRVPPKDPARVAMWHAIKRRRRNWRPRHCS